MRLLVATVTVVALLLVGATGAVAAQEGGVVVCGEHSGQGSNAGVHADSDSQTATVYGPDPNGTQQGLENLFWYLQKKQTIGPSILHVSVTQDGEEAAGAGSDDLPDGGGDWRCKNEPDTDPVRMGPDGGSGGNDDQPTQVAVVVCGGHTGNGSNAGVIGNSTHQSVTVFGPEPGETQDGVQNFGENVANNGRVGNSVVHVSVNTDGAEAVGVGSDDTHENDWECSSEPGTKPQPGNEDGVEGPHPPRDAVPPWVAP